MNRKEKVILIVDDDADCLYQLEVLIRQAGHEVVALHSQTAATQWLELNRPDLALFDLMMEREDSGFILSRWSKKRYPEVPVVILTAVTPETGIQFDIHQAGSQSWIKADLYLEKGLNHNLLINHIHQLLNLN